MFTTEEKVNLLKKAHADWLAHPTRMENDLSLEIINANLSISFSRIPPYKKPEEITMQDIVAEER